MTPKRRTSYASAQWFSVVQRCALFHSPQFKWNMSEANLFMSNWPSQWLRRRNKDCQLCWQCRSRCVRHWEEAAAVVHQWVHCAGSIHKQTLSAMQPNGRIMATIEREGEGKRHGLPKIGIPLLLLINWEIPRVWEIAGFLQQTCRRTACVLVKLE